MPASTRYNVAIVGASGAVGREVLRILETRKFPVEKISLFSSKKSTGTLVPFRATRLTLEELKDDQSFSDFDFVFFTAGSVVAEKHAPRAARDGAIVIDNSSLFRMSANVPLIVPEVNGPAIDLAKKGRIIANPNCTTAQMVVALKPLHDHFKIQRVVLSSYQAVSGKGQKGIDEFQTQIKAFVAGHTPRAEAFAHPIAFNALPHIDVFRDDGFTGEEQKVMQETRKIMGDDRMRVLATCVRVPVFNCHSESVNIETERPVTPEQAREILSASPGIIVADEPSRDHYPLATMASGRDEVFVGRIRRDPSLANGQNGLVMWIVADNLRKGAALNAVQIAELAIRRGLVET